MEKLLIMYSYYLRFGQMGGVGVIEHDFDGTLLKDREIVAERLALKDAEKKERIFRRSWIEENEDIEKGGE